MRKAVFAEWILRRFATDGKAASLAGDLLEIAGQQGNLWFWRSFAGIVLRLAWRPVLGWIAALYVSAWLIGQLNRAAWDAHAKYAPHIHWTLLHQPLTQVDAVLLMLLVYSAVRFGIRSSLTQIAACEMAAVSSIVLFWWNPVAVCCATAFGLAGLAVSLATASRRKAVPVALLALASGVGVGLSGLYLLFSYQEWLHRYSVGHRALQAFPSLRLIAVFVYVITAGSVAAVSSALQSRWLRKPAC